MANTETVQPATALRSAPSRPEWLLIGANLGLGALLWGDELSDYQVAGTIPSLIFPFLVGLVALLALPWFRHLAPLPRRLGRLACLPSLLGSATYVLLALVALIPPFTLGAMFFVGEVAAERTIQEVPSPDGSRIATVILHPVGAYGRGWGRVIIRVHHAVFPLVEREIHHVSATRTARGDPMEYIQWKDDDTIWISETDEEIKIGVVESRPPTVMFMIYLIAGIVRFVATGGKG
jgi:hypothetical protein